MDIPGIRFHAGDDFYMDWFPRGGDNMVLRAQLIDFASTPSVSLTVYTKNMDETGPGTVVQDGGTDYELTLSNSNTNGDIEQVIVISNDSGAQEGLEELVRVRATVGGTGSLLARIFSPIFFDASTP